MNAKIVGIADNAVQIQIEKEDYSIADILHRELLNVKHVKFSGVPPPHPLIKTLTVQVHTDGANPIKLIREALDLAQERVVELLNVANQKFPRAFRERSENPAPLGIAESQTPNASEQIPASSAQGWNASPSDSVG
jgi:DNA-directed RNA polymerase subunit L